MQDPWYRVANVDQIASPSLLLFPDRVRSNLQQMIRLVGDASRLRPHVKTHKIPQIIQMKLELGITKFKASTIAEVEMTAGAGGKDILLSYQPVGPNIRRLLELTKKFPLATISAIVDSFAVAREIERQAEAQQLRVPLYIDLNVGMNRTGIVPGENAESLYRQLHRADSILAAGFHVYDGHLHESDIHVLEAKMNQAFEPVWSMKDRLMNSGIPVPNIIAGGTPTSKLLARMDGVEVGAGTIALWDAGQPALSPDLKFDPALVVLGRVISHPITGRICIDVGHKAIASEMAQPRAVWFGLEDAKIVMHNEEHMVLETDKFEQFPVGKEVYGLPKHVCPTVALHSEVWCVRYGIASEPWPVLAKARRISI